jgi:hypothetical protein
MAGGRPTKYSDEVLGTAVDYLYRYDEEPYNDVFPSVVGLACVLKISKSTLYDWASQDEKEEFSDILVQINQSQERVLLSKGLTGDFNSAITKLVLGKHGYHDKQDTEITGKDGKPIEIDQVWEIKVVD